MSMEAILSVALLITALAKLIVAVLLIVLLWHLIAIVRGVREAGESVAESIMSIVRFFSQKVSSPRSRRKKKVQETL